MYVGPSVCFVSHSFVFMHSYIWIEQSWCKHAANSKIVYKKQRTSTLVT